MMCVACKASTRITMTSFCVFSAVNWHVITVCLLFFFFQAEDGIRDLTVTRVQTCALPILRLPGLPLNLVRVRGANQPFELNPALRTQLRNGRLQQPFGFDLIHPSDIEAEKAHVAVFHNVVAAFEPHLSAFPSRGVWSRRDEVIVGDDLGLDEATLDVAVDDARSFRCPGPLANRP